MAEPSSTLQAIPAIVLGGSTVASAFPGVDPFAVIGAGGGAGLFVMLAVWIPSFWAKMIYFLIAWSFGVLYAVQGWLPESIKGTGSGIKGFFAAFVIIMLCTSLVEFVRTGKLPGWIAELMKLRLKRGGTPDA